MARTWDEPKEGCQPSNYVNHIGTKRRQVVGFYYDRKWRVLVSNPQSLDYGPSALPLFYFPKLGYTFLKKESVKKQVLFSPNSTQYLTIDFFLKTQSIKTTYLHILTKF